MISSKVSVISVQPEPNQSRLNSERWQNVQLGISNEGNVSYWDGLHVFSILGACALVLSIQTLIPRHNSIIYQNY